MLKKILESLGFVPFPKEPCLFLYRTGVDWILLAVYVDDLLSIASNDQLDIWLVQKMKSHLGEDYKDLGRATLVLGITVERSLVAGVRIVKLSQPVLVREILNKYDFVDKIVDSPYGKGVELLKPLELGKANPAFRTLLASIVGSLNYLASGTYPQFAWVCHRISSVMHSPPPEALVCAKRVLQYLNTDPNSGIEFRTSEPPISLFQAGVGVSPGDFQHLRI